MTDCVIEVTPETPVALLAIVPAPTPLLKLSADELGAPPAFHAHAI